MPIVRLIDPTTEPLSSQFARAPRLKNLRAKRLGIIDNSKVNAGNFLRTIVDSLQSRFELTLVKYHRKPSASKPATSGIIEEFAQTCDFVIAGVGD